MYPALNALLFTVLYTHAIESLEITRLRVEYEERPIGIDETNPRFFWALEFDNVNSGSAYLQRGDYQTAYQITIYDIDNSSSPVVADSGKVTSNETSQITVNGFTPQSHKDYKWCVNVWNSSDVSASSNGECSFFSMGLINGDTDWENAEWLGITDTSNNVNNYFTNEFRFSFDLTNDEILNINKVRIYIATPNYYKAWLNNNELDEYHALGHFTTFEETCYYDVIDCTSCITAGSNKNTNNNKNNNNNKKSEKFGKNGNFTENSQKIKNNKNKNANKNTQDTTVTNVFSLMLGQGWYSQSSINIGVPMFKVLIYILFNDDQSGTKSKYGTYTTTYVTDDTNWYTHEGPVRMNDIYVGEYYDSRQETNGWTYSDYNITQHNWQLASKLSNVNIGKLKSSAIMPKIEKIETFSPVTITQPVNGVFVVDFGQNVAGFTRLKIPTNGNNIANQNITMIHSEQLYPNGTIQQLYSNSPMIAIYTMNGENNNEDIYYEPYFTYFGYQYVQITGYPGILTSTDIESIFIHSNFNTLGDISFGPSNIETPNNAATLLNKIQKMTRYASLSNWMNIPTDCPQRERRGWLGDAQLTAEVTMYNFDMGSSYTKFLYDIKDAQIFGNKSGALPDCAPYYSHGALPGDPSWTSALININHWMYKYYGDKRIISKLYNNMKKQLAFLDTQLDSTTNLLPITVGYYGDWCAAYPDLNDAAHKSTIIFSYDYAKQALYLSNMADVLGYTNDSTMYYDKSINMQKNILKYYFDTNEGYFVDTEGNAPVSTLQSLCLDLDIFNLVNSSNSESDVDSTVSAMVNDVVLTNNNHLATGIIGVKYVLRELCKHHHCDVALNASVLNNYPSFGNWFENGATTLWENWQTTRYSAAGSKNHIMFGGQGLWYYQYLAGIRLYNENDLKYYGWNKFIIEPYYNITNFDIYFINANIDTVKGNIQVNVNVNKNPMASSSYMTLKVNVPINSKCLVYISRLATFGSDYVNMNEWIVKESNNIVWQNNVFANGASNGVVNGQIRDENSIEFEIDSGYYTFDLYLSTSK